MEGSDQLVLSVRLAVKDISARALDYFTAGHSVNLPAPVVFLLLKNFSILMTQTLCLVLNLGLPDSLTPALCSSVRPLSVRGL